MRPRRASAALGLAVVLTLGVAACSTGADAPAGASSSGAASPARSSSGATGSITVFAAASLQQTFTELGERFEQANPGATVQFSFAGSSDLVTQIQNGAPADVFASADQANMAKLGDDDLDGRATPFATNVLEIAVAPGNPEHVRGLDDLDRPGLQVVTCAEPVPCGAATAAVERAAGVTLHPVSEEQSVTDVLGKVTSGQADAGLVYVTDVQGADGKVDGVPFAASSEAVNTYPIAVLRESRDPATARAFSDYVRSTAGQRVLAAAGFGAP